MPHFFHNHEHGSQFTILPDHFPQATSMHGSQDHFTDHFPQATSMEAKTILLIIFHKLRAWKPTPFYWIIFHKLRAWKPTPFYCEEGSIKWSLKYQKRSPQEYAGLWPAIFKSGHMAFVSGRTHALLQGHVEGSAEPLSNLYVGI